MFRHEYFEATLNMGIDLYKQKNHILPFAFSFLNYSTTAMACVSIIKQSGESDKQNEREFEEGGETLWKILLLIW